jgi:hypothetical protein
MRALRNRENVFAFEVRVVRIEELLLDARDRFLPGDEADAGTAVRMAADCG